MDEMEGRGGREARVGCRWWLVKEQGRLRKETKNDGENVLVLYTFSKG